MRFPSICLPYCLLGDWWRRVFFQCCVSLICSQWFDQNFYSQFPHRRNWAFLILPAVIASTIYIWDYILTFNMEVDLVWKSRWTLMKALYLFQRYLPFIEAAITLYRRSELFTILFHSKPFCPRSNRGKWFDEDCVSAFIFQQWRFVNLSSIQMGIYISASNGRPWVCCIWG